MTSQRLKDRVALVTGGARGIGQAIAARLVEEGASVMVADIDEALARRTAEELGQGAVAHRVDIGDEASIEALRAAMDERFGRCEILVNNAAILDMTSFSNLKMPDYLKVIDINQHGAVRVTLAMLALLRKGREGKRILNIASIMGVRGSPDSIPYSTAKGGIVNFTRALACDLAPEGIVVNALAPGFIDTAMAQLPDGSGHEHQTDWFRDVYIKYGRIPLRRAGMPEDIAGPAYFLCSDDARYVTGQILLVDGGVSATF